MIRSVLCGFTGGSVKAILEKGRDLRQAEPQEAVAVIWVREGKSLLKGRSCKAAKGRSVLRDISE